MHRMGPDKVAKYCQKVIGRVTTVCIRNSSRFNIVVVKLTEIAFGVKRNFVSLELYQFGMP